MGYVHLFNPENDVALGFWKRSFTLSPLVNALRADGASLPIWYASAGDYVYDSRAAESAEWYDRVSRMFELDVHLVDRFPSGLTGCPWGWSYEVSRRLESLGAAVPEMSKIERIRELSHRGLTIEIMDRLRTALPFALPETPVEAGSPVEVRRAFDRWGGHAYVKAPWSSSGRGVVCVDSWSDSVERRVENIIRRQGSVLCEPAVDKRRDFAMEFHSEGGKTAWVGYSLFYNGHETSYAGNILAPDSELEDMLVAEGADRVHLQRIRTALTRIFDEVIAPWYDGYFGVDMMVDVDGMIVPCVEVNLRMTMGVVATLLRDRYLAPGCRGLYRVGPLSENANLKSTAVIDNGRLARGLLRLTPPCHDAKFAFSVEVSEG